MTQPYLTTQDLKRSILRLLSGSIFPVAALFTGVATDDAAFTWGGVIALVIVVGIVMIAAGLKACLNAEPADATKEIER